MRTSTFFVGCMAAVGVVKCPRVVIGDSDATLFRHECMIIAGPLLGGDMWLAFIVRA